MKSCSFFQLSSCNVIRRSFVSSCLSLMPESNAHELKRLVKLLQIIDQEMRPRPTDRLLLTDDSFFEVEAPLAPPEDFRPRQLAFERAVNGVPDRALLQINFAVTARGFKCEPATALT